MQHFKTFLKIFWQEFSAGRQYPRPYAAEKPPGACRTAFLDCFLFWRQ